MLVKYQRDDRVDVIDPELLDRMEKQKEWISVLLIAVGAFILFKAHGDYLAMRQARLMLLAADFV